MEVAKSGLSRSRIVGSALAILVLGGQTLTSLPATATAPGGPIVIHSLKNDVSAPLRDEQGQVGPNGQYSQGHRALRSGNLNTNGPSSAGQVQTSPGAPAMPSTSTNFEGGSNAENAVAVLPPDPNGDIGPNHYVQWVNLHYRIWNRAGVSILGPTPGNTPWAGFGGVCQTTNQGDPVVRYDRMADRWVFSQFAFATDMNLNPVPPYYQCFAVSATPDPTGPYNRYAFQISNVNFNDYPKLAVWPDAYYMTFNYFDLTLPPANQFQGAGALAFDRAKMLNGQPATAVSFTTSNAYGGLLASDLDGSILPPAGSPNYVAGIDTNIAPSGGTLQIWKFHVDFVTPANSTFGTSTNAPDFNLAVPTYRWFLCSGARSCLKQPGTNQGLDAIPDRLMNRLQYRHFADGHESLVANHTIGIGTTGDQAAIRWYEVRNLAAVPTIYQQGTYSPSTDNRWMGSIAMDQAGDIALGYSVSSTTVSPSIRYTGRLAGDPLGTLPQGEATLIAGGGSQTSTSNRWGDYSMMAVDPTDDCTFWYTQEYYSVTSDHGWQTRVGSFRFPGCGTLTYSQVPQGNWVGTYGADGYNLLAWNGSTDAAWFPQATLVLDQGLRFNSWGGSAGTTDVRALQSPDTSTRRATCVYDPNQLRLHLTFSSAYSGMLHLYALDWDSTGRREAITINDGSGPRTANVTTAFDQGAWVSATISVRGGGTVTIAVDHLAGYNAVLSGIFLGDAPSLVYTPAPHGSWVGTYGASGYDLLGWSGTDLASLPLSTLVVDQGSRFNYWSGSPGTTEVRALQSPDGGTRRATCVYDPNQVRFHLTFTGAFNGMLHLYVLDWDSTGRREAVTVNDGSGPRTANITSAFDQGAWITASINVTAGGSVTVTVDHTAGYNAVVSGIFLGGPTLPAAPSNLRAGAASPSAINLSWTGSAGATSYKVERSPDGSSGWTQIGTSISATFADTGLNQGTTYFYRVRASNTAGDSAFSNVASATTALGYGQSPQGNWVGTYGASGYDLLGWSGTDLASLPLSTLVVDQGSRFNYWSGSPGTTEVRALQSPDGGTRRATCVYDPNQVRFHLTFTGAFNGMLHLYVLDWDSTGRREAVTVNDGSGPRTANITSAFDQGAWITASINVTAGGSVTVTVDHTAGYNAVVSGIFLG